MYLFEQAPGVFKISRRREMLSNSIIVESIGRCIHIGENGIAVGNFSANFLHNKDGKIEK